MDETVENDSDKWYYPCVIYLGGCKYIWNPWHKFFFFYIP